jgi:hypothetical protein
VDYGKRRPVSLMDRAKCAFSLSLLETSGCAGGFENICSLGLRIYDLVGLSSRLEIGLGFKD